MGIKFSRHVCVIIFLALASIAVVLAIWPGSSCKFNKDKSLDILFGSDELLARNIAEIRLTRFRSPVATTTNQDPAASPGTISEQDFVRAVFLMDKTVANYDAGDYSLNITLLDGDCLKYIVYYRESTGSMQIQVFADPASSVPLSSIGAANLEIATLSFSD